jgi:hypothetical protein
VFVATRLDEFIAGDDGAINWRELANAAVPAVERCGYSSFMESFDVLVLGRATLAKILSFSDWPCGQPLKQASDISTSMGENHSGIPGGWTNHRANDSSYPGSAWLRDQALW